MMDWSSHCEYQAPCFLVWVVMHYYFPLLKIGNHVALLSSIGMDRLLYLIDSA